MKNKKETEIKCDSPKYMETMLKFQQEQEILNKEEITKVLYKIQRIIQTIFVVSIVLVWFIVGFKSFLLTLSICCLLMYLNISITSLANAFISRGEHTIIDVVWRLLFIIIASIGFGVYFNI